jgi:hypothetical protein
MSLQALAQQMAAKGRHGDDMLVHMSKGEVAGLQQLAEAAGGSLTVNPETGQPEAFFLAALLPTLLGAAAPALGAAATGAGMAGLGTFLGSKMGAAALGGVAGGLMNRRQGGDFLTGAITGGLGGYGGAGIAQGLQKAGAGLGSTLAPVGTEGTQASMLAAQNAGIPTEALAQYGSTGLPQVAQPTALQQMGAGLRAGPGAVVDAMGGGKAAMRTGLMAASPLVAGMMPKGPDMGDYPHPILSTEIDRTIPSMGGSLRAYEPPMPSYTYQRGNVYVPTFRAAEGGLAQLAKGGMKEGGFVVPADVVALLGEGNTEAGYDVLEGMFPDAVAIRGKDGGQADTVETSIEGEQPARVAHGEVYLSPEDVKRVGGAKKLYAMLDKVREQAMGTKKQVKPVDPERALA